MIQYLEERIMSYAFNTDYTVSSMYLHALGHLDSLHAAIVRYGILLDRIDLSFVKYIRVQTIDTTINHGFEKHKNNSILAT